MNFSYKNSQLDETKIAETGQNLAEYISRLNQVAQNGDYGEPESSLNLPTDASLADQIMDLKQRIVNPNLKYLIVVGIGGSNLGTKAVYDALLGYWAEFAPERFPKIFFVDTVDADYVKNLARFLSENVRSEEEFLINCISKSGSTTESIANFESLYRLLNQKFAVSQRIVITTDNGSKLHQLAKEKELHVLTIPDQVGGRYSVLSAVGLFPLAVCGLNIDKLRAGAAQMRSICLQKDILQNPAAVSAAVLYLHNQTGKAINDNFFFNPRLHSLGLWYRQLMGESIGKDGKGITPTVSIGSTDLHSVAQLYMGGPKDKITTFVHVEKQDQETGVPEKEERYLPMLAEGIEGKKLSEIMTAILKGTKDAYAKQNLPFVEIALPDFDEKSLGEFMQFKMIEMMYLGKLMKVNAFDQPNVESYKSETRKILSQMKN